MPAKKKSAAAAPPPLPATAMRWLLGAAAFALVVVVPLVWDVTASSAFRGTKSSLAIAAWTALAGVFVAANLRSPAWRDPWLLPWVGVIAAGLLSAAASAQPLRSAAALVPVVLAGLGVTALRQQDERGRARLRTMVLASGVVQALLVLLLRVPSLEPRSFRLLESASGRFSIVGTIGNPADVAVFLALPAILAAALALENRRTRLLCAAASLLMTGVVVSTATLSVAAAMAVGFAILFWHRMPRRLRLPAVVALAVAAAIAVVAGPVAQRIEVAVHQVRQGDWLWFGSGRATSYAAAFAMLGARPLTGVGFGLFGAESFRFQDEDALAVRGRILDLVTGFGETHSEPLQFAAENGLVGVVLLGAACAVAWRRRPRTAGVIPAVVPVAAVAALVAAAQFPLHLPSVAAQWAVLLSLALPPLAPPPTAGTRAAWLRLFVAVAVLLAGVTVAWNRHRAARAIRASELLVQAIRAGGADAPPSELAAAALPRLEQHLRWVPYSLEGILAAGNLAIEAKRPHAALRHFSRALALDERPETRFDVGMTLLLLGEQESGYAQLVRAVKLNPAVFKRIVDPDLSRALRKRLDADGYGLRHPWIYADTPAARP